MTWHGACWTVLNQAVLNQAGLSSPVGYACLSGLPLNGKMCLWAEGERRGKEGNVTDGAGIRDFNSASLFEVDQRGTWGSQVMTNEAQSMNSPRELPSTWLKNHLCYGKHLVCLSTRPRWHLEDTAKYWGSRKSKRHYKMLLRATWVFCSVLVRCSEVWWHTHTEPNPQVYLYLNSSEYTAESCWLLFSCCSCW